ncbi:MAG: DUF4157 domain-containing protein [Longimicrobiales bacterium]
MIGFLRTLAGEAITSPVELPDGVSVVRGRWIPWIGGLFTGAGRSAAAVTIGTTIVVHPDVVLSTELVRHELEHVRQWRNEGWRFPFRYARLYARHGYRQNPYEVAAREAEQPTP